MKIDPPAELACLLLGVELKAQGVGRLDEVGRRHQGLESAHGAHGKGVGLVVGDELADRALRVRGLPDVLLEQDPAVEKPLSRVPAQAVRRRLPVLVGLLHLGVRDQGLEKALGAEGPDPGEDLALGVFLDVAGHRHALVADVGGVRREREADGLGADPELGVEVVEGGAVRVQDDALEGPHAEVLQGDGVFVPHGLEVVVHGLGQGLELGLGAEGPDALVFLGQDHVVVRDVGNGEGPDRSLPPRARGAGRSRGQGGEQVQDPVFLLHDNASGAHPAARHQVQLPDPAVVVGQDVDGPGKGHHVEGVGCEWIQHVCFLPERWIKWVERARLDVDAGDDPQGLELGQGRRLLVFRGAVGPYQVLGNDDGIPNNGHALRIRGRGVIGGNDKSRRVF